MDASMKATRYLVIQDHTSEYPEPITFEKGAPLTVGEKHDGPEGWDALFFCDSPGRKGGCVPAQIIERVEGDAARAREDYTAREHVYALLYAMNNEKGGGKSSGRSACIIAPIEKAWSFSHNL